MEELKSCPFCGSPAELTHTKSWDWFVRCTDKGCAARTRQYHENDVGAVSAWNARAERTCNLHDHVSDCAWCSECGWPVRESVNYCPRCGAKVVDDD